MYNLMDELKQLMKKLDSQGDRQGSQAVHYAILCIENLTYSAGKTK